MRYLETNEWILLNDIILKIHTADDDMEMRRLFLNSIRFLVPFDSATFYIADEKGHLIRKSPVAVDCPEGAIQKYDEVGEKLDFTRWVFTQGKNMVYREADLYPEEVREQLPYYIEVYKPFHLHYSAQMSLSYNQTFVGVVSLYRSKEDIDFSEKEMFALDILKDHLAYYLYMTAAGEKLMRKKSKGLTNVEDLKLTYKLTEREVELIELLFQGFSNEESSKQLSISLHTVKKHLLNIYRKTGVTSRLQLFFLLNTLSEKGK